MADCPGITYSPTLVGRTPFGGFGLTTQHKMIADVQQILLSYDCTTAHDVLFANWQLLWKQPVKTGDVIADPGFNAASLMNPTPLFTGYAISVTIDGIPRGNFAWTTVASVVTYQNQTSPPVNFPLVAGVDFIDTIQFGSVGGDNSDGVAWNPSQQLGSLSDLVGFDAWFCCASTGFNCCGGPPAAVPKFLIPPSSTPAPGEENATTPVLNKAIYLSNYTFQFTNNFGRVKKI
jgi:hypothetical protein